MPRTTVAAVTIGQTPRDDLVEELLAVLPDGVELRQVGALDDVAAADLPLPGAGDYPLTTRLRDGSTVTLDEAWLTERVQAAVRRAEADGAAIVVLLCAGGFDSVAADVPFVRPSEAGAAELERLGAEGLLVVVPSADQLAPATRKWEEAGFVVEASVARLPDDVPALAELAETTQPDAVVLDYVGHPASVVLDVEDALEARTDAYLVDLGRAAAQRTAALVDELERGGR